MNRFTKAKLVRLAICLSQRIVQAFEDILQRLFSWLSENELVTYVGVLMFIAFHRAPKSDGEDARFEKG